MEAKHTPGKWQIGCGFIKQERKDGQKVVRIVAPHPEGGGQDIAECLECNASLIAAAPELMTELKRCIDAIRKWGDAHPESGGWIGVINGGLNAIAKAEGGSK